MSAAEFSKANIQNIHALTPLQEGMLFHALLQPDSRAYLERTRYHLSGPLDEAAFRAAWAGVVQRHDILRSVFVHKNVPEPLQLVLKQRALDYEFTDLSELTPAEQTAQLAACWQAQEQQPFDLSRDRLMRIRVFRLSADSHEVIWVYHHILLDGWSLAIIHQDFLELYRAAIAHRSPQLPAPISFSLYAKWLRGRDATASKTFWKSYLSDYSQTVGLPRNGQVTTGSFTAGQHEFALPATVSNALRQAAIRQKVTLNTILQTLWGWALAAVTGRRDVVFAATVSGRPPEIPGVERMVGLLINAVPVRVQWSAAQTCGEVWARVQSEATAAKAHHHASLADIQSATPLGSALFDHILVFENYPVGEPGAEAKQDLVMDSFAHADHTNYDLTVQLLPDEAIGFRFLYNRLAYAEDLFPRVQSALEIIAESITQSVVPSLTELLQQPRLAELFPESAQTPLAEVNDVYLLGSFTLDPLAPVLAAWLEKFGIDLPITLGPYHQVFQEVMDASSHYARNRGVNVLCVRWEDWLRDGYPDSPVELAQSLQRNLNDLLHALEQHPSASTLVVSLPSSTASQPAWVRAELDKIDTAWQTALGKLSGLRHLNLRSLAMRYGLAEVSDPQTDHAAHLPYTEAAYAAIATELARAVIAGRKSPFKVIAVDCDNTLWRGVAAEEGATTVGIDSGFLALQEFLLRKVGEGFLIALCSKNNEADVWEVFERHEGMRLRREHITAQRINWQLKSTNLRELARELNVGLDSFVFLDDSENECAEVAANAPEVLSLRLPPNPEARANFLEHLWALDKFQITQEDRTRTQLYQQERARQQAQQSAASLDDFIRSLNIRITISPVATAEFERVAQLIQRTNQFNLSTIRRSTTELQSWLNEQRRVAWVVRVQDRFGNYGLSGVLLTEQREPSLYVDTWLLSCRVLGRRVEHALQLALQAHARSLGCATITVLFRHSEKNAPARDFLQQHGWQLTSAAGDDRFYELPVPSAAAELPEVHWQLLTEPFVETEPTPVHTAPTVHTAEVETNAAVATTAIPWEAFIPDSPAEPHRAYYEALRCHDERALLTLLQEKSAASPTARESAPPESPTEQALFTIWKELLGRDDFGVTDNFFTLGGHSLKATRMLSRVFKALERELQLMDIFQHPTIRGLAQKLSARDGTTLSAIPRLPDAPHYALSHAQRRMWTLHQMEQHSIAYNTTGFYRLTGALDVAAFTQALNLVVQHHESLRTTYRLVDDEPRQHIQPPETFAVEFLDWSHLPDAETRLLEFAEALSRQPIDLEQGPLFIAKLVRFAPQSHLLALHLHHIVSDGWAMEILERETLAAYEAIRVGKGVQLPTLTLQYRDYSAWQNGELQQTAMTEHRQYWQQQFAGELKPLDLPTDRPRPSVQTFQGSTLRFTLERPLWQRLKELAQTERTTPFVTLIALIKTLLHRYTGQIDIIVGTVTAGRDHPDLENLIGLVANTIALRDSVSPQSTFLALLRQIARTVQDAFAHQALPFDVLLESLDWKRDISRSPLFDVMVVLQNQTSAAVQQAGLQIEEWNFAAPISRFDLTFNAAEVDGELCIDLVYNTELFRAERMQRLAAHFQTLAQAISHQPQCSLATVPILTADEVTHLTQISSRMVGSARYDGTIIDAFERQVAVTPAATALCHGQRSVSYHEIDNAANRLAAFLLGQSTSVAGQPIAVMSRDKSQVIAALLGIMKAGAAYLPIDPDYPAARIQHLLSDSRAPLLLIDEPTADLANLPTGLRAVSIGECLRAELSIANPQRPRTEDIAYIIYTSGSTGKPKGVQVEHRGFMNMIRQQIEVFDVTSSDRVIQFASLSFDASLSEIFMALLAGATLCLPAREVLRDPGLFLEYMAAEQITVATLPPAFLRALGQPEFTHLRTLITAGESAVLADVRHYAPRLRYFNAYGPTECSVCASMFRVPPDFTGDTVPIGEPLANTRVEILDGQLQPVPWGHLGEICVSGAGLAHGYLHQPELTARSFVPHPQHPGERLYRTGDVGRWNAQGQLEFLGRRDDQVKIRGHRIELAEVEAQLLTHPHVTECVVLARDMADGAQSLVAYVVLKKATATVELKDFLTQRIPAYAVPSWFVPLAALPVTPNGKVDKRALPMPEGAGNSTKTEVVLPRNEMEQQILQIWEAVLRQQHFGIRANFFDLGGDSIQAIQIVNRLRRADHAVQVKDLFLHPTVETLARALSASAPVAEASLEPEQAITGPLPLTAIQRWFFQTFGAARNHFNHSELLRVSATLTPAHIRAALSALSSQHAALRLRFQVDENGQVTQALAPASAEVPLEVIDLRDASTTDLLPHANRIQASLDVKHGPLFKVALFQCADGNRLLFVLHHLIVDGVSWRILLADFCSACEQARAAQPIRLPSPTLSFLAWTQRVLEFSQSPALLAELAYWQGVEAAPASPLPRDFSAPTAVWSTARHAIMEWSESDTRHLVERVGSAGLRLQDHLLAALAHAVGQWTESSHLRIALEGHGRYPLGEATHDLSRTVGWFTCVYPVVLPVGLNQSLPALAETIQGIREQIPNHGLGYGLLRYVTPAALLKGGQLTGETQISFNYLGRYDADAEQGLLTPANESDGEAVHPQAPILYDLSWNAMILNGRLRVVLTYSECWHRTETMERVLDQFSRELHSLRARAAGKVSA